jgi:hypothetical protein
VTHPVAEALDGITAALAGSVGVPLWSLDAADTAALLTRAARAEAALDGLRLALLTHAETAGVAQLTGAPTPTAWVRAALQQAPGPAKADLRLARALTGRYAATAAALAHGTLTLEQARTIVRACDARAGDPRGFGDPLHHAVGIATGRSASPRAAAAPAAPLSGCRGRLRGLSGPGR